MTEPDWFLDLQLDLAAPVMVPDGAVIAWDQCRDRFLVPLLQRLEGRTSSPHPAIVRRLLQRRLAGEDVTDELSVAARAATAAAWAADWATADAVWVARAAASAADWAAAWAASAAASAAERTAQLTDLRAAIAASTQPPAGDQLLPDDDGIEEGIDGPERKLLRAFYVATNSEGGSTDQVYLRGIRAVLAHAASGYVVPTAVQPASPAPVEEALQRLLQWGGTPGCIGYSSEVVMGVVNWANDGMVGPLPPLPEPLRLREARKTAASEFAAAGEAVAVGAQPPAHSALERYGITWDGSPLKPLLTRMADGYWTPWHVAATLCPQQAATIADLEAVIAGHEGEVQP